MPLAVNIARSETIDEVVVTAPSLEDTLPQELAKYGTRVETITAADLKSGGYYDIGQALQALAPGLYIAPKVGPFDYVDLSLQGSRTNDVLWMVDGVRISNRLYNSTTPIDTIPAHMVERIEILEGGQALFFGTQSAAGAVNIVTKAFSETPDSAFSFGADSNDGKHFNGYFRDGFGAHQVVLYGSSDEADGFRPFRKSDFQPSATDRERGYDVVTFGAKYAYEFNDALRLSATYQNTDAELDHTGQPKTIAKAVNERKEDIVSAKLDYTPGDAFQLFVKGYYHAWDAYYSEIDNDGASREVISDREFWGFEDYGLNLLTKFGGGKLDYFVGYDFQRYSGQDDVLLISRQKETVHAPFAQVRTTSELFESVKFAAGLRHNKPDNGDAATVWNVSGHWDIAPTLFVRGTAGTAFRLPDAYELFAIDPCCEIGNPNLRAETSKNFNLSIGGKAGLGSEAGLSWEIIGFVREVTDLISVVFDPVQEVDTFENVNDKVKVRGGQAVIDVALNNALSIDTSFTYTDAERSGSGMQVQDIPQSQVKIALDYNPVRRPLGASVTVNRVGNVYRTLGVGRQEFGNYTVVDLAARYFVDDQRHHRIGARLENIFDKEYATRVRQTTPDNGGPAYAFWYLGTPRTLHVNYTYQF